MGQIKKGDNMICNQCGATNEESSKFCKNCGHEVSKKASCKNCGTELLPNAAFCVNCGTKVIPSISEYYTDNEIDYNKQTIKIPSKDNGILDKSLSFFSRMNRWKWLFVFSIVVVELICTSVFSGRFSFRYESCPDCKFTNINSVDLILATIVFVSYSLLAAYFFEFKKMITERWGGLLKITHISVLIIFYFWWVNIFFHSPESFRGLLTGFSQIIAGVGVIELIILLINKFIKPDTNDSMFEAKNNQNVAGNSIWIINRMDLRKWLFVIFISFVALAFTNPDLDSLLTAKIAAVFISYCIIAAFFFDYKNETQLVWRNVFLIAQIIIPLVILWISESHSNLDIRAVDPIAKNGLDIILVGVFEAAVLLIVKAIIKLKNIVTWAAPN